MKASAKIRRAVFEAGSIKEPALPLSIYIGSGFINLMGLALPLTILHIYDRVLPNQAFSTLAILVIGLISVVFIEGALRIARGSIMAWRAASFSHRLSMDAMGRLMSASSASVQRVKASSTISQLQAAIDLAEFQGSSARLITIDIAWAPIFAIVITIIAGPLILVPILCLAIFLGYVFTQTRRLRTIIDARESVEERKYDFMLETLQTMQTVKSHAMEPLMMRRFERLQSGSSLELKKNVMASQSIAQAGGLFAMLMTMGIVAVGGLMVINDTLTIGALAACMLLSSQMMQPIMRSVQSWSAIVQNAHKRAEVEKLYTQVADQSPTYAPVVRHQPSFAPASVEISGLGFDGYEKQTIFSDIHASFTPGQLIGIKGPDGSGRSVLLRCVMGAIAPTHGRVLINGAPPNESGAAISYVGQVPQLFQGSILDNLTLFGTYTTDDARWVAELVGLAGEINRLPNGYDTQLLGSANPELSAAFSQLICIARAVISKPAVLLLDSSNSGLDAKTETSFSEMLKRLSGKTTILMAIQRPSLLRQSDYILELADKTANITVPQPFRPQQPVLREKAS